MAIETSCSGCGKKLSVGEEHAGKRARCPACGQIYTVPYSTPPSSDSFSEAASNNPFSETVAADVDSGQGFAPDASTDLPQFWMRSQDGTEYGPVDRDNLNRWFREGRVGTGYQIRQGDMGSWQDASYYRPTSTTASPGPGATGNPYAAASVVGGGAAMGAGGIGRNYPKPDKGVVVLIMGILSFVVCFGFGIAAVIMGRSALRDINAGQADPEGKTMVQIGYYLGIANLILHLIGFCIFGLIVVLQIVVATQAGRF